MGWVDWTFIGLLVYFAVVAVMGIERFSDSDRVIVERDIEVLFGFPILLLVTVIGYVSWKLA